MIKKNYFAAGQEFAKLQIITVFNLIKFRLYCIFTTLTYFHDGPNKETRGLSTETQQIYADFETPSWFFAVSGQ